jgi:hypothetical protein
MKEWLTYTEAALILGRSKRTLRRWVGDPANRIETQRRKDEPPLLRASDLRRVEAAKHAYATRPTFGRAPA